jgi:hypothetical protein
VIDKLQDIVVQILKRLEENIEDTPLYRVRRELQQDPVNVTAINAATSVQHRGRQIEAIVEDIHEVTAIEY